MHRTMHVALVLDRGSRSPSDCAGDTAAELQVVVRCVDDRVHLLLDEVSADDHDAGLSACHISSIRSSSNCGVAPAMPRTPIDSMVSDAHATPHTIASCSPARWAPVVSQRASIPPASAPAATSRAE